MQLAGTTHYEMTNDRAAVSPRAHEPTMQASNPWNVGFVCSLSGTARN